MSTVLALQVACNATQLGYSLQSSNCGSRMIPKRLVAIRLPLCVGTTRGMVTKADERLFYESGRAVAEHFAAPSESWHAPESTP